jgi:hypothetical protein
MPSTSETSSLIRLHINDNVQIARTAIEPGQACDSHGLTARDAVLAGTRSRRSASPPAIRSGNTTR